MFSYTCCVLLCFHKVKSGEDPYAANKENIKLNFDTEKDNGAETTEVFHSAEVREFKFAQPKCPVRGRLTKSSSGSLPLRTFSDPSPQVNSHASLCLFQYSICS